MSAMQPIANVLQAAEMAVVDLRNVERHLGRVTQEAPEYTDKADEIITQARTLEDFARVLACRPTGAHVANPRVHDQVGVVEIQGHPAKNDHYRRSTGPR